MEKTEETGDILAKHPFTYKMEGNNILYVYGTENKTSVHARYELVASEIIHELYDSVKFDVKNNNVIITISYKDNEREIVQSGRFQLNTLDPKSNKGYSSPDTKEGEFFGMGNHTVVITHPDVESGRIYGAIKLDVPGQNLD